MTSGRIARGRARAELAARRYEDYAQEHPLLGLPLLFLARYTGRQGVLLASAVAFRLFLWLMPLALLISGVLAGLSRDPTTLDSAARSAGVTGAVSKQVIVALRDGRRSWWVAVLIGSVAFLWTTRTLMRTLSTVNAHIWQAPRTRPRQKDVLVNTLMFAGSWLLVLTVTVFIGRIDRLLPWGFVLSTVFEGFVVSAAWLFISSRLPDRRTSWLDLVPGSILFGSAYTALHVISSTYLPSRLERSEQLYGSLGIAAAILAWLLVIGQIVVSGALVNSIWAEYRTSGGESAGREPGARADDTTLTRWE